MMKECVLMIDGGTTNTRFTLLDGDHLLEREESRVGASDAGQADGNCCLEKTVTEVIRRMEQKHGCEIHHVYASGMITSGAGLYEVGHLTAPVSLRDLAEGMVTVNIGQIGDGVTFHFVPGVKFYDPEGRCVDMMRGEETEIFGALTTEDYDRSVMLLHFGSHNKMIAVKGGRITDAVTTIGGELLWAALQHTILKTSAGTFEDDFPILEDYVKMGYREARQYHMTRALFLARIHGVMEAAGPDEIRSYIYGVLIYSDLEAFAPLMDQGADRFIFYGRDHYIEAFMICVSLMYPGFHTRTERISFEASEWLSFRGICRIIEENSETADGRGRPGSRMAAESRGGPGSGEAAENHSGPGSGEAAENHSGPGSGEAAENHSGPGSRGAAESRSIQAAGKMEEAI